ncbi:MAG: sodium:calcium antiporter, partial [Lachnospiraceae bacterium]|nr:sodium:calcium antiporter [Lachnospiraceae bacterium]
SGNTDILFGNVIGSNIANIFVILGMAVVIVPFNIKNEIIKKQIPILLLVTLGFSALFLDSFFDDRETNALTRADGIVLLLFFSVFIYYLLTILKSSSEKGEVEAPKYKLPKSILIMLLGLAGVILASDMVVDNVAAFAATIGISQKIITVTIISIGTSLPELVTTVLAAKKGENNMAIGNIVGSNIFNICVVLGLPVIILGEAATVSFGYFDILFLVLSVIVAWVFASTNRALKRYEGFMMILVYCAYAGYIMWQ